VSKLRPRLIIEVGSWKGRSAINMATACKSLGLETEIVCVDTWLGPPGIYTRKNDPFYASLGHKFGYPQLYYTFLTNVVRARHQDMITPLPLRSALAAEVLREMRVKAPLIYIDAAHDYDSVLCDLRSYWNLLTDDGVLFGDDYVGWPGVTKAANEFAGSVGRPIFAATGKFVIPKNPHFPLKVAFS